MNKFQSVIDAFDALVQAIQEKFGRHKASGSIQDSNKPYKDPDKPYIDMVKKNEDVGIRIGFFFWNFVVRPFISLIIGLLCTFAFVLLDAILGTDLIDFWIGSGILLLFTYLIGMGEKEIETIPEGRMAMVTWFGTLHRIYRTTGEYKWTGKLLRLGRTRSFKEPMTDAEGFFFTDVVQVNIWNVYETEIAKRSNLLIALTKTGGEVKANLLLMLKMRDPMLWITKTDPMMDIGERSRMTFRTAVSFFTGKDVVSVKNLLTELMSGHVVLSCFLKKGYQTLTKHSLVRDSGGDPIYESVKPGEELATETIKLLDRIKNRADKELLENVQRDTDGELVIESREISESLEEVLHACGVTLTRASVGFIGLPEEVVKAANQADAQPYQLTTQRASAEAAKAARDILAPSEKELNDPTFADRQAFAAASDPDSRVEVIHISGGGGDVQKAAAIIGAAVKKGGKK